MYANNKCPGGFMLRWWTSEEQAKQSPPVPTHSADEEEGIESEKGSWAAGTELHAYDMFGRIEAVRRESGLLSEQRAPQTTLSALLVYYLGGRKPEQCRQWSDPQLCEGNLGFILKRTKSYGNFKPSIFTLQRSSSCFHGVWNGKKWNLNLKPKLCFIIF